MKPEDVAVWSRFVDANPGKFDSVDYNFAVGKGAQIDSEHPENIKNDFTLLTQKKIDAVGYSGDLISIIEVKPIADMRGLGQVIAYAHLFADDFPGVPAPSKIVLAGDIERDLLPVYAAQGVQYLQA